MKDWQSKLDIAASIAFDSHRQQFRNGRKSTKSNGVNYIVHPAEVIALMYEWEFEPSKVPDLFCSAWLHDAAEDFPVEAGGPPLILDEISMRLGSLVNGYVHELTRFPGDNHVEYKESWLSEKLPKKSTISLIVKLADQICNIQDFRITSPLYVMKYKEKSRPIYKAFCERISEIQEILGKYPGIMNYDCYNTWEDS